VATPSAQIASNGAMTLNNAIAAREAVYLLMVWISLSFCFSD
jgi:hypothetical protein